MPFLFDGPGSAVPPVVLAGELGYADASPATGTFVAREPFAVRLELDELL